MDLNLTSLARPRRLARAPEPTPTKKCIDCKRSKPLTAFAPHPLAKDGLRRACKHCVAKGKKRDPQKTAAHTRRARKRRKSNPRVQAVNRISVREWTRRNPQAPRARTALYRALKRGEVKKPDRCSVKGCTRSKLEGHHADYRAPLLVLWSCRSHHRRLHAGEALPLKAGIDKRLARIPREIAA